MTEEFDFCPFLGQNFWLQETDDLNKSYFICIAHIQKKITICLIGLNKVQHPLSLTLNQSVKKKTTKTNPVNRGKTVETSERIPLLERTEVQ